MSSLLNIASKHWGTFYDYDTGARQSIWKRTLCAASISLVVSLLVKEISSDAIAALLTVQSILIGFSFSVLFFLLSGSIPIADESSIEQKLNAQKLTKLSNELFYNVSYFNVVATFSVVVALLLLLPGLDKSIIFAAASKIEGGLEFVSNQKVWVLRCFSWISEVLNFALIFLFLESTASFIRTISRVSFFFEKRLKQQNGD